MDRKYFYVILILSVLYCILFYVRKIIQGYYKDREATLSIKDLAGKTVVITGGNSGIGLASAIHFAKLNAKVIIACRNKQKAESAVKYIQNKSGNIDISWMKLDLSDLESVKYFAEKINENDKFYIDYLILNAGIFKQYDGRYSKNGLSSFFQINYLSHWYLTNLLLNRMKQTANKRYKEIGNKYGPPVRIVAVSSGAHSSADIPLKHDEWDRFIKKNCSYGQSKLLQIMHLRELITRMDGYDDKIQCIIITPGLVRTSAIAKTIATYGFLKQIVWKLLYPFMLYLSRDIMTGSQVVLHVCCNDNIVNGGYYSNCLLKQSKGTNGCSHDKSLWNQVWNRTDKLINQYLENKHLSF